MRHELCTARGCTISLDQVRAPLFRPACLRTQRLEAAWQACGLMLICSNTHHNSGFRTQHSRTAQEGCNVGAASDSAAYFNTVSKLCCGSDADRSPMTGLRHWTTLGMTGTWGCRWGSAGTQASGTQAHRGSAGIQGLSRHTGLSLCLSRLTVCAHGIINPAAQSVSTVTPGAPADWALLRRSLSKGSTNSVSQKQTVCLCLQRTYIMHACSLYHWNQRWATDMVNLSMVCVVVFLSWKT